MTRSLFLPIALLALMGATLGGHQSATASPAAEIKALRAASVPGGLQVTFSMAEPVARLNTQVLIDTDLDAATGHSAAGIGADLLVEAETIYSFDGDDPAAWEWRPIGRAVRQASDLAIAVTIKTEQLKPGQVRLVGRTLDDGFALLDQAPGQAALLVTLKPPVEGLEPKGDADDPTRDLVAIAVLQDGQDAVLQLTTAERSDFATTLVFFDTDNNPATGYQPAGDRRFGFDQMLTGGTLSAFAGETREAWTWSALSPAEQSVEGSTLTIRLDAALLKSEAPRVAVWTMSPDWQRVIDQAPDQGLYTLKLDPSKLQAVAEPAPVQLAEPKTNRHLPARVRVANSQSFYCYYGSGRVNELSHYDVVILHSPQMKPADIARLNALGVVTIGYITVGEDDTLRVGDGSGPGGQASWYFDRKGDGQPDQNGIWKSWYANADDPAWRADRVKEARRLIEEDGYHGIFLDTLDTAQLYPESEDGMVQLVADLREALPDAPIILNQGFKLFDRLAPMADGLMLESFTATYDFQSKQYKMNYPSSLDAHLRNVQRNLRPVLEAHPMPIFVLDYALPHHTDTIQQAADRAASFGFQFAAAPIYLDDVYVNDIVGKPNDKWLKIQATPEAMSLVLGEPANGFPAGTKLMPSSCYAGYTVAPLVDGIQDRSSLHWSKAAWASSEDDESDTWLAAILPQPIRGGALTITWATDSGVTHTSQNYQVKVRSGDGPWRNAGPAARVSPSSSTHVLPTQPFSEVRIVQSRGGGSVQRPDLMWLAQLQLDQ